MTVVLINQTPDLTLRSSEVQVCSEQMKLFHYVGMSDKTQRSPTIPGDRPFYRFHLQTKSNTLLPIMNFLWQWLDSQKDTIMIEDII